MSTAPWQGRRLPIPAAWPVRSSPAARPWAIISAGLAPIMLTGAYLIAGILQPASYSPVRTTISAMAGHAGTDRWVMTGGIVLTGGCYLVTAAGLTGVRASARALLFVAGMAGIGIAASPETARVLGWLLAETRDGSVLGLAERLTSSIQTCWPFIVGVALRRTRRPRAGLATGGSGGVKDGVAALGPAAAGRTGDGSPPGGAAGGRPACDRHGSGTPGWPRPATSCWIQPPSTVPASRRS